MARAEQVPEVPGGSRGSRGSSIGGQITLATGDGSVTLDDAEGDVDVDTGDGSVSVAGKLGIVKLHTGDGSITFRAEPGTTMKDNWSLTTGDGGISVYLPSDFGAQLDAHTGDGGKTLRIRTGDGSVRLKTS